MKENIIADRASWFEPNKTFMGTPIRLVAIQKSRRTARRGRTSYIYQVGSSIYYNQSRGGVMFAPIAPDERRMSKYYDVFVGSPYLTEYNEWRERNDYKLVGE